MFANEGKYFILELEAIKLWYFIPFSKRIDKYWVSFVEVLNQCRFLYIFFQQICWEIGFIFGQTENNAKRKKKSESGR